MFICFFLFQSLKKIIDLTKLFHYTGWPRENATLTINNLKKKRDRMKKYAYKILFPACCWKKKVLCINALTNLI